MKKFFPLLFIYSFARIQILIFEVIPFSFDHGKDSLAVMHMLLLNSPKLIGPWTSIPGLFFGPGWYYLLAPGFLLTNFHPMSGVITIMLLGVLQLWLVWKYFGSMPALIIATVPVWFMVTTSAWNPFPMTLVTWLILIIFEKLSIPVKKSKQNKIQLSPEVLWGVLGFLMASGFHFSSSFAVLYPVLIFISVYIRKIKVSWRKFLFAVTGFLGPFLPQLIFELRHSFTQTKGVLAYIKGDVNIEMGAKPSILNIFFQAVNEVKQAILPTFTHGELEKYLGIFIFGVVLFLSWKWRNDSDKKMLKTRFLEFTGWFVVTVLWLYFTHYNFWYLFGLMPLVVVLFTEFLKHINHRYSIFFAGLLIFTSCFTFYEYVHLQSKFSASREFLPIKKQAIDLIYEKSEGESFSSYQYVPDVYDFSYQYLYFWNAIRGKRLPVEFAYEPNITEYVTKKSELLEYFSESIAKEPPTRIYFIVEKPQIDYLLEGWWNRQKYSEIINEFKLSDDVTVYEAIP